MSDEMTQQEQQVQSKQQGNILLDVKGLKKYFPIKGGGIRRRVVGYVKAVDNLDFFVREGETLGLVGESGCGKTTAGRAVLRLYEPTAGEVYFKSRTLANGEPTLLNLRELSKQELKLVRQDISMIFQDPINSLNPRMTVYDIITEPLIVHNKIGPDTEESVKQMLARVGLRPEHIRRYPHEFSGGQRQRIGIARSLILNPQLIICDEPVSALDVSVQAQTLNLLNDLKRDFDLSYIFVAHDLSVVQHISDRVAVMYVGRIVEMADALELYAKPKHPYTEALMSSVPKPDPHRKKERILMRGDVADPSNPPSGCLFHPRCQYAQDICVSDVPKLREVEPDRWAACHFVEELDLQGV